jgi:phage terminase Nu1 subunit (DNA packaging protein)
MQTARKFIIVRKYVAHWPVRDMLKLRLKYTSERARLSKQKAMTTRMKKVTFFANTVMLCIN